MTQAHAISRLQLIGIPGCNKILAGELSRLVRRAFPGTRLPREQKLGSGAVAFPFDPAIAILACRFHRTSSRILWDLYQSRASSLEALYDEIRAAAAADRRMWATGLDTFSIRPRNVQRFPAGERQVVGAVKNALIDGCATRGVRLCVDAGEPDLSIAVRGHDDAITVSIDLGGPRTRRGYRKQGGKAPLRENLAASLLMLARYDARADVLIDPMAGSGTIAIEAALMARGEPLGTEGCNVLAGPVFSAAAVPEGPLFGDSQPQVVAIEVDTEVAAAAAANIERAGVADRVSLVVGDFRGVVLGEQIRGSASRLVVSNPPYGRRVSNQGGRLANDFARWCEAQDVARLAVLIEDPSFSRVIGRRPRSKKPLSNAGLRSYFYLFDGR